MTEDEKLLRYLDWALYYIEFSVLESMPDAQQLWAAGDYADWCTHRAAARHRNTR